MSCVYLGLSPLAGDARARETRRMERIDVRLLGGFSVAVDGTPVPDDAWPQRRAQDLVKLLALAPGHRRTRDEVLDALWPHLEPEAAAANLHKAASYARRVLGAKDAVVIRRGMVELAPAATVQTDVERGDGEGELLPDDRYEEWTVAAREELAARRTDTLRAAGRWDELLAADPADEEAHRALMRAHADAGDRVAAARQYRRLRDAVGALGLTPSPASEELFREVCLGPPVEAAVRGGPPVIGRDDALRTMARAITSTDRGTGGTVLLGADAGMGKTRLVDAALADAARRGWHTVRGTARADEGGVPYAPVVEALDALLAERADLAAALPGGVRAVLGLLTPFAPDRDTPAAPDAPRHRVLGAVGQLVLAAARERGLLLALEDLHAADEATLELVAHLARAARRERLLLVASTRPVPAGSPVAALRGALVGQGAAVEVTLDPLGDDDIAAIAARAARRDLPAATRATIVAAAAGNPFFAEELGAVADDLGELRIGDRAHRVLDDRLARLPGDAARVVPLAAALEEPVEAADLAELAGISADAAAACIDAGIAGDVLEARPGGGARFRHPLLREAARHALGPERLRDAHAAAARRLRETGAAPERIAHHLLASGDDAAAVPLLADAARRAAGIGAFADGQRDVERALDVAPAVARADLLLLLADLRHATGDRRAPATYAQAIAAGASEDADAIRLRQARAHLVTANPAGALADLAALAPDDAEQQWTVLVLAGTAHWYAGDIDAARAAAHEARARADGLSLDEAALADLTDLEAMVAHADGAWASQMEWQLGELWNAPDVAERVFDGYLCVSEYILHAGDPYEHVAAFATRVLVRSARAGARRGEAFATTVLGETLLLGGDPAAARAQLLEATRLNRAVGSTGGESLARARLGEALLHLGDRPAAQAQLEEAVDLAHASPLAHHVLYLAHHPLLQLAEDPAEALAVLEQAETLLDASPACRFCPIGYWSEAAGVAARAGEPARGREFLDRAEGSAKLWRRGPWAAAIAEARSAVLHAEGDTARAETELHRAVEGYAARGQRLYEDRARARLLALA